jgi:hypothetical protein
MVIFDLRGKETTKVSWIGNCHFNDKMTDKVKITMWLERIQL